MQKATFLTKNVLLTVYAVLNIVAIFVLSYLLVLHFDQNGTCGAQLFGDCGVINKSEYSVVLGVPVALLGILWLGAGVMISLIKLKLTENKALTVALLINGALSIGFSLYLVFVEAFVLKEWCQYCLLVDLLILLSFISALFIYILELSEKATSVSASDSKRNAEKIDTADVAQ